MKRRGLGIMLLMKDQGRPLHRKKRETRSMARVLNKISSQFLKIEGNVLSHGPTKVAHLAASFSFLSQFLQNQTGSVKVLTHATAFSQFCGSEIGTESGGIERLGREGLQGGRETLRGWLRERLKDCHWIQ